MGCRPLLLGHRGARATKSVVENTIASFDLALAHGCDGFEFDVRLTADGEAVIAHDPAIGKVEIAATRAAELAGVPTLREVLTRYRHTAYLDIELKVPALEKITCALLHEQAPSRGYVVSSFLPEVLQAMHDEDPKIPLGYICDDRSRLDEWRRLPLEDVIPHQRLASRMLIKDVHQEGKKVLVWTVNNASDMQRLAKWAVDGIVSDRTEELVRVFGSG